LFKTIKKESLLLFDNSNIKSEFIWKEFFQKHKKKEFSIPS
jgi:hypothetical protein